MFQLPICDVIHNVSYKVISWQSDTKAIFATGLVVYFDFINPFILCLEEWNEEE